MDTLTQTLENIPVREEIITTKDICVKLWREFGKGIITKSELRKELAYVAISSEYGWNELRRKPLPTKPYKLVKYLEVAANLEKSRQHLEKYKLQEKTFQDIGVAEYVKQASRVQAENIGTIYWLRELKVVFDKEGDIVSMGKVQMRIEEFFFGGGEIEYNKLY